jgi:hypothetical protein
MSVGRSMPDLHHGDQITATTTEQISNLLHEVGETYPRVFRIIDGADDD